MAEIRQCSGIPENNISSLKDAILCQQQLLQKLNAELDEEREASATATSEALAMILRLQGEKAAIKMEADQYKRMAEEKMCHAELSLEIFEDLIYQKEMEIASLEFQVQAYRYKLLSAGYGDLGVGENRTPESLFFQNVFNGGKGVNGNVRRMSSLPVATETSQKKGMSTMPQKSGFPSSDAVARLTAENLRLDGKLVSPSTWDINSYWEQIRKSAEPVIEISDLKYYGQESNNNSIGESTSSPVVSYISAPPCDLTKVYDITKFDQIKYHDNIQASETAESTDTSPGVQDIFEVPQNKETFGSHGFQAKEQSKLLPLGENRLGKPDSVPDQSDWIKKMLLSLNHDKMPPNSKPREWMSMHCDAFQEAHKARVPELRSELQKVIQRIDCLEKGTTTSSQEIIQEGDEELKLLKEIHEQLNSIRCERGTITSSREISREGDEELNLLKEIREQLDSIQCEMRRERKKKEAQVHVLPLHTLTEAMLHFWL